MCGFVVTVRGGQIVLAEKKTAKKEACVAGVLVVAASKPAYAGALGQTYVRQSLPVAPPRFTRLGWWPWLF